jgi:hypothetical protein
MATKTRRRKLLAVSMTRRRGSCQRWRRRRDGRGRCRLTKKIDRWLLYMCMFTVPFPFHRSMPVAWLVQLPIPSSWQENSECHARFQHLGAVGKTTGRCSRRWQRIICQRVSTHWRLHEHHPKRRVLLPSGRPRPRCRRSE